jgi:hypothetical protein|tara:strand:- start:352 stop:690 length:339 start_codon:yes stop_codon:yes gene_type:complete
VNSCIIERIQLRALNAILKESSAKPLKQLSAVIVKPPNLSSKAIDQHESLPNHIYKITYTIPFFGHCRRFAVIHSLRNHSKTFFLGASYNPGNGDQHESNDYQDFPTFHTTS